MRIFCLLPILNLLQELLTNEFSVFISHRALAREGDYKTHPVGACVRVCVHALVCHADFSKTATATDFL